MIAKFLHILPAALEEFKLAVAWYMHRSPSAAEKFVDEVDHAINLIAPAAVASRQTFNS